MSARNERMLAEMGIKPFWRLRVRPDADFASPSLPEPAVGAEAAPEAVANPRTSALELDWPGLEAAVAGCARCPRGLGRRQALPGAGGRRAAWLLVAEAPDGEEDRLGELFVGPRGQLLDAMLRAVGLQRGEQVYLTSVLKCHAPGGGRPESGAVSACAAFLAQQIRLVQPSLIVALGEVAAQTVLQAPLAWPQARGQIYEREGIPVLLTHDPAVLLTRPELKAQAWEDLCRAMMLQDTTAPI